MSYFEYYETDAEGNPKETPRRFNYSEWGVSHMALLFPGPKADLAHFIALACAAPKHPVDVTHWKAGELVYSGRLVYHVEKHETKPVIII